MGFMVSEHFSSDELACHHCGVLGVKTGLVLMLEAIRAAVNRPIVVDDAYRCPAHNAALGNAAPNSQHVLGNAADIRVIGMKVVELYHIVRLVKGVGGIGVDLHKGYIHVDIRPYDARWCYDIDGNECAWDATLDV